MASDLTFISAPRISAAQFARVLQRYGSPCAPLATELYGICVEHGVDPAVALAFFAHESKCGTVGTIKQFDLKNWGAVRTPVNPVLGTQVADPYFFRYFTWQGGLHDWCERITRRYIADRGLATVRAATPVYAPASDDNKPQQYADAVCSLVERWQAEDAQPTNAPTGTTDAVPTLAQLGIVDIRALLPSANWIIGTRPATTSITIHYNGPAVEPENQYGGGLRAQLIGDARWQMRAGWGGTTNGAPGLMYHYVVARDGAIYQTRDENEILWHCAHGDGNTNGLSLHFPLGGAQEPTPEQWQRGLQLVEALRARYGISRSRVLGHLEWKHATACPGRLQPLVEAYRAGEAPAVAPTVAPAGLTRWRIKPSLTLPARIRQDYHLSAPVAARFKPGTIIYVDVIKDGESVNGDRRWAHLARVPNEQADLGFVSMTLLEAA